MLLACFVFSKIQWAVALRAFTTQMHCLRAVCCSGGLDGEDPPNSPVTSTKQTFETKTVHEPLEKFKEKEMGKDRARMDRVERGDCRRKVCRCCLHVVVVCFLDMGL